MRFPRFLTALLAVFTLAACEAPTQTEIEPSFSFHGIDWAQAEAEFDAAAYDLNELARGSGALDDMSFWITSRAPYYPAVIDDSAFRSDTYNIWGWMVNARYDLLAAADAAAAQDLAGVCYWAGRAAQRMTWSMSINYVWFNKIEQGWNTGRPGWSSYYTNYHNQTQAVPVLQTARSKTSTLQGAYGFIEDEMAACQSTEFAADKLEEWAVANAVAVLTDKTSDLATISAIDPDGPGEANWLSAMFVTWDAPTESRWDAFHAHWANAFNALVGTVEG